MKTITDGSAVFTVRDKRIQAMVDMFYPVGSMYISADKNKTKADFPFMQYGTWTEVPANLCLQTGNASEAGTQRSAGLPNITGGFRDTEWVNSPNATFQDGVITKRASPNYFTVGFDASNAYRDRIMRLNIDASKFNSIYGASNTVQPPAYMVRAWVRTA